MKTLPALAALALAALTFTGCTQQATPAAAPTTESTTTATTAASEYLEVDGKPGIKVSDLNTDAQAGPHQPHPPVRAGKYRLLARPVHLLQGARNR